VCCRQALSRSSREAGAASSVSETSTAHRSLVQSRQHSRAAAFVAHHLTRRRSCQAAVTNPGLKPLGLTRASRASRHLQTTLRAMRAWYGQAARRSVAAHLKAACSLSANPLGGPRYCFVDSRLREVSRRQKLLTPSTSSASAARHFGTGQIHTRASAPRSAERGALAGSGRSSSARMCDAPVASYALTSKTTEHLHCVESFGTKRESVID